LLEIKIDKAFKKDIARDKKSGRYSKEDFSKLKSLMDTLIEAQEPEKLYLCHKLLGDWKGYSECHIKPNWLLIYKRSEREINFARLGTHQQLFKNF
jgi:mRNA interferase YafQ